MNIKKLALFIVLIYCLNFCISLDTNESIEQKANLCFNQSKQILIELENNNFSVQRVNDSLKALENLYDAQILLKEKKKPYEFSSVIPYCNEIKSIRDLAFQSRDDLIALKQFYKETVEGLNTSSIDVIISEAEIEIKNERYEKVSPLTKKAYNEITKVKSEQTTLNLFYQTTTRSIGKLLNENKYYILAIVVIFIFVFFIYKKAIYTYIIKRKINGLELRKNTLKDLIMKTQKDYFEKGIISEGAFTIKTKKLAELIRDIDRQVPLLQEELVKISWVKNKNTEKK